MHFQIQNRAGKTLIPKLDVGKGETVKDIMSAIHKQNKKLYPARQRLTVGATVLEKNKRLADFDLKSGQTIVLKDLGPQIGWRTVFLIEYAGPPVIYALFYLFPSLFYPGYIESEYTNKTFVQQACFFMIVVHFLKYIIRLTCRREYESLFVHRFSADTMPIMNLPKNCFHYWILCGLSMGYWINIPGFTSGFFDPFLNLGIKDAVNSNPVLLGTLMLVWAYSEVSNYITVSFFLIIALYSS